MPCEVVVPPLPPLSRICSGYLDCSGENSITEDRMAQDTQTRSAQSNGSRARMLKASALAGGAAAAGLLGVWYWRAKAPAGSSG